MAETISHRALYISVVRKFGANGLDIINHFLKNIKRTLRFGCGAGAVRPDTARLNPERGSCPTFSGNPAWSRGLPGSRHAAVPGIGKQRPAAVVHPVSEEEMREPWDGRKGTEAPHVRRDVSRQVPGVNFAVTKKSPVARIERLVAIRTGDGHPSSLPPGQQSSAPRRRLPFRPRSGRSRTTARCRRPCSQAATWTASVSVMNVCAERRRRAHRPRRHRVRRGFGHKTVPELARQFAGRAPNSFRRSVASSGGWSPAIRSR